MRVEILLAWDYEVFLISNTGKPFKLTHPCFSGNPWAHNFFWKKGVFTGKE
jgi:hypothetical protein